MKLSEWANSKGISYRSAWRMWKAGRMPVPVEQLPTGTLVVHSADQMPSGVALYARVSSADQKNDLDRQLARLAEYAALNRLPVIDTVREVGSALNGRRRGLLRLLGNPEVDTIIVEHGDRLTRFGLEYLKAALAAQGRKVLVVDDEEMTDDIVRDLHDVIISMCARLYGRRSARNRASRAMKELHRE